MKNLTPNLLLLIVILLSISCSKDENKSPQVAIGVIQDNMEIVKGIPISFTVDASDEDGEVTSVLLVIDGVGYDTATAAPYEYSWETIDKAQGAHTISAQATDNEGATSIHEIKVQVITDVDPVLPCQGGITISYEGQTYNTLQVGGQCWLRENMNVTTGNSAFYNNDPGNGATYGKLYSWEEAMTACPPGWHLPSYEEWCTLVKHVDATAFCDEEAADGTDAGFKLKSAGGWANERHGSDQFGFKARPGGYKGADGAFTGLGQTAAFWSSTESAGDAFAWLMTDKTTQALNSKYTKTAMLSVRCIRD
jgi:uncharacterized protein (TIGR02145 family)